MNESYHARGVLFPKSQNDHGQIGSVVKLILDVNEKVFIIIIVFVGDG